MQHSDDDDGLHSSKESRKDSSKKRRRKHRDDDPSAPSSSKRSKHQSRPSPSHSYSASSSSRIPNPIFGDDLLRAEREEARQKEEREWKAKLNHLASEDFYDHGNEFASRFPGGLNDVDEDDLAWEDEMQRHFSRKDKEKEFDETVPRRWRKGPAPVRLEEMEEEEYAEAIREGMWKRTHGKEIEEMEKAKAAQEKAKAKEAKRKEERRASKKKKREAEAKKIETESLVKARAQFHQRWKELREDSSSKPIYFSDLPWPTLPATSTKPLSLSKSSIEEFLFSNCSKEEGSELHRLCLRLYHPDRFTSPSNWWKRVELGGEKNVETIKEASKRISQSLAEIGRERKEKEKSWGR